jgi:hypothetical protein
MYIKIIAISAGCAIIGLISRLFWVQNKRNEALLSTIKDLKTTQKPDKKVETGTLERLEGVERRMEALHDDVLKKLQRMATYDQRIKKHERQQEQDILEEEEEEGMTEEEARQLLAQQTQQPQVGANNGHLTLAQIEAMANRG